MTNITPRGWKDVAGKLLLLLASLAVALAVGEVVLRTVQRLDIGPIYRVPDARLGWTLEPGADYVNRLPEASPRVIYNSQGFRDVEHELIPANEVIRVVILGDSFMEAYSVELQESFHMRLERTLRALGTNLEVVNLGVGGYGTLQQYLLYREVGQSYEPSLVLLGFYGGNDISNNSQALDSLNNRGDALKVSSRPFLVPGDQTWTITQVDFAGARRRYEAEMVRQRHFRRQLRRQSALLRLASRLIGWNIDIRSDLELKGEVPPTGAPDDASAETSTPSEAPSEPVEETVESPVDADEESDTATDEGQAKKAPAPMEAVTNYEGDANGS